jgi:hypothetical protein
LLDGALEEFFGVEGVAVAGERDLAPGDIR